MRFASLQYLLLIFPALAFFLLFFFGLIGKEAMLRFSSLSIVKKAGGRPSMFRRFFLSVIRLFILLLLVLALARPQTGTGEEKTTQHVIDVMLALDVSGSMATLDFQPDNRLGAAKLEAKRFIEGRKDDRIGLVIFAGQSFTQCPLTVDHQAIQVL